MPVQKHRAFVLEYKFFDQLANVNDIALYAFISRIDFKEDEWPSDFITKTMKTLNLSKRQFDKSLNKLLEIGFLKTNKDI